MILFLDVDRTQKKWLVVSSGIMHSTNARYAVTGNYEAFIPTDPWHALWQNMINTLKLRKMAAIFQTICWIKLNFDQDFTKVCSQWSN